MVHALLSVLLAAPGPAVAKAPAASTPPGVVVRAADPEPGPAPIRLSTADDVARLCRALEPSERLRTKGDAVEKGEAEAGAAGARRVLAAQRGGTLALGLVFDLPDDATCATGSRGKTRTFTIPVEPVSWRWTDGEAALARGGATADRPLLTAAQGAKPHVDVGEPIAGPPEARKAVLARASELEACYAEALRRDPAMDGVLVADLGGARPAITADSVGDAGLATCVQKVLGPLAPAQGGRLAVPLRFVLDPPGMVRAPPVLDKLDKPEPEATPDAPH